MKEAEKSKLDEESKQQQQKSAALEDVLKKVQGKLSDIKQHREEEVTQEMN